MSPSGQYSFQVHRSVEFIANKKQQWKKCSERCKHCARAGCRLWN